MDNREEVKAKELPKKQRDLFKVEKCKVLKYDSLTNALDFDFLGYGLRLYDVENFSGDTVDIKYKGTIGKPDFVCKLWNSDNV